MLISEDPVGELWHSTAIVLRLGPRCVQTKSGSQYKLIGPMNDKLTLQQGKTTVSNVRFFGIVIKSL